MKKRWDILALLTFSSNGIFTGLQTAYSSDGISPKSFVPHAYTDPFSETAHKASDEHLPFMCTIFSSKGTLWGILVSTSSGKPCPKLPRSLDPHVYTSPLSVRIVVASNEYTYSTTGWDIDARLSSILLFDTSPHDERVITIRAIATSMATFRLSIDILSFSIKCFHNV